MTLLETHPGETEAEFRAVADGILQAFIPDKPKWWHPYEVRGTYEYAGIRFLQFYCIAGSVELWIWKLARESTDRRVILLSYENSRVSGGEMVGRDVEVPVQAWEVNAVGTMG